MSRALADAEETLEAAAEGEQVDTVDGDGGSAGADDGRSEVNDERIERDLRRVRELRRMYDRSERIV